MDKLKDYFLKYRNKVSFIELKKDAEINVNGYIVTGGLPLPIPMDDLIDNVKEAADRMKFNDMVDGMIYTIGIDESFPYADKYKEILKAFSKEIESVIINTGNECVQKGELDKGMIYFRAAYALNKNNLYAIYNYSIALEEKAKRLYDEDNKDLGTIFLTEAMEKMEEVRDKDEEGIFPNAHYKLGYYYKAYNKNIKAKESWEKFLETGAVPEVGDEVRNMLEAIENDVIYEEGCELILNGEPRKGLEKLLPLTEKYEKWWNLDFMTGVALRQIGDFKNAMSFFRRVLEVNPSQVDTLNEMGLCKANTGDMHGALEFFSKALTMNPGNPEIMCNRGMAKLQVGDAEGAVEDIKKAYETDPEDEVVKQCVALINKYSE